jgi:DNA invertase Pin-like site-specific DNA recombinase
MVSKWLSKNVYYFGHFELGHEPDARYHGLMPSPTSHQNPCTAVYMRCSSRTQATASQRHEIEEYLLRHAVVGTITWYVDEAVTGTNLNRPQLRRLHNDIVETKVDCVIIWKLDRLSRNIADGVKLLSDWTNRGVRIISITQQLDLSGPLGRMIAALLLGVAEMEKGHLRQRQSAGIAKAKSKGVRFGRPRSIDLPAVRRLTVEGLGVSRIAKQLRISRQSVYNALGDTAA